MLLFLGLIFILLDVRITVGTAMIGLLPDFIGCLLVMKALEKKNDPWRHLAFGLSLTSLALYIADLIDKGLPARIGCYGVGFAAEIAMLALLYHVIRHTGRPRELFPVLVCIRILWALLSWIPLVGSICAAAAAVVSVCFLMMAFRPLTK